MRPDLAALTYLEYRQIVNRIRRAAAQPGRAALYLLAVAYFAVMGMTRSLRHHGPIVTSVPEPYASAAMFAYVSLVGVIAIGAASGIVGAFSSPADARFLTGSHISERTVMLWLQLRRSAGSMARMLLSLLLYVVFVPRSGTLFGIGFTVLGGTMVATLVSIPSLKLRAVAGARSARTAGAAVAAAGILGLVILLASILRPIAAAGAIERTGAGAAFNALLNGNPIALCALYAFGAALIAFSYAVATGLYPDLYASSLRVIAMNERTKRGGTAAFTIRHAYERREQHPALASLSAALNGPWTIAWKECMAFSRSASMQRLFLFGLLACAAVGGVLGTVAARAHDPLQRTIELASIVTNLLIIFVAMGSAIGLAGDLRKPLWWMGPDPLWTRLFAWVAGTSWRMALCIAAGIAGWAAAMHHPAYALAGIPFAVAAVLYLRAVGLALYALFPSTLDQRGPLAMVRALLTYLLAAPPVLGAIITAVLLRSLPAGLGAGIAVSLGETIALVAFASARIDGRGAAFAQAEGM